MSKPKKKLKAEPEFIINGKKTDAPFHEEMLASVDGQNASDLAAVRLAIKYGWSRNYAIEHLVSSPALRAKLRTSGKIPAVGEK
jgi:hypothetical protein